MLIINQMIMGLIHDKRKVARLRTCSVFVV